MYFVKKIIPGFFFYDPGHPVLTRCCRNFGTFSKKNIYIYFTAESGSVRRSPGHAVVVHIHITKYWDLKNEILYFLELLYRLISE